MAVAHNGELVNANKLKQKVISDYFLVNYQVCVCVRGDQKPETILVYIFMWYISLQFFYIYERKV